ncbi:hypothetical protein ACFU76_11700 [Streptomyces sp. NPDC057539]|uniref:hypothetical protein n=1 Tax=Streptomyces sp. NPDC057539 TaxID=3346159 RepID=UPI0036AE11AA
MANAFNSRPVYAAVLHNINQASADPIEQHEFEKAIDSIWSAQQEKNLMPRLDTGAVFGGRMTALRWPQREIVDVPAERVWYEPTKPLVTEAPGGR